MSRYVERDEGGLIVGHFACLQPGSAEEELQGDHPDLVAFATRLEEAMRPKPDPLRLELDDVKARLAKLEAAATRTEKPAQAHE